MPNEQTGVITMTFVDTENRKKFVEKFEEHEVAGDGAFCYPLDATRGGGAYIGRCGEFELVGTTELKIDCVFRGGFTESDGDCFGGWLSENRIFMRWMDAYWFDFEETGSSNVSAYDDDEFIANKNNPDFELEFSAFDGDCDEDVEEFVVEHFGQEEYDSFFGTEDDEDSDEESDEDNRVGTQWGNDAVEDNNKYYIADEDKWW